MRASLLPSVPYGRVGTAEFSDTQPQESDDQDQDVNGQADQDGHHSDVEHGKDAGGWCDHKLTPSVYDVAYPGLNAPRRG